MNDKSKIIELVNDWIRMNPTFKKKFLIEDIYHVSDKIVQVTTQPTTKTNQLALQRMLPNFLKYASIEVYKVFVTNLFEDFNFENFIKEYLLSTGLKDSDFVLKVIKPSPYFTNIEVLANINVLKLLSLKNINMDEEELFMYDKLNKKYRGQFFYKLNFTQKLNDSILQLNQDMREYLTRTKYWDIFEPMNPTIGMFNGDSSIEVFINNGQDYFLERTLDGFFKFLGLTKHSDWRTYKRGPWLDEKEVEYGLKN